jgi:hypothetical protein
VADTEFIDTSLLLQFAEAHQPGITTKLRGGVTVLSGDNYYRSIPPKESDEAQQNTLKEKKANTLGELAARELDTFPPRRFQTILQHPFGESDCIWIDEPHTVDIESTGLPEDEVKGIIA